MQNNYLELKDNVIDKLLLVRTKAIGARFFFAQNECFELQQELVNFYAFQFTNGDKEMARKIISSNSKTRK